MLDRVRPIPARPPAPRLLWRAVSVACDGMRRPVSVSIARLRAVALSTATRHQHTRSPKYLQPLAHPPHPAKSSLCILIPIARACAHIPHTPTALHCTTPHHVCHDRALAELRLPAPQAEHKGANFVHHTGSQAIKDAQRAQQQWHRQLLCHYCHARHQHHRAAHLLEEAGRRWRWRLRQDLPLDQLQHRQLPRGT